MAPIVLVEALAFGVSLVFTKSPDGQRVVWSAGMDGIHFVKDHFDIFGRLASGD